MKRTTQTFGALGSIMLLLAFVISVPVKAVGEQTINQHVMISEVSPEVQGSGSNEYIELYNPLAEAINVTSWQVQYRSASHTPTESGYWSTKAIIGCNATKAADCGVSSVTATTIGAGETLRLSSFETTEGIQKLSSGMATPGGQVRLVSPTVNSNEMTMIDMVGYGTAQTYEGTAPAVAPKANQGIVRIQDGAGAYVDTDSNQADFVLLPPPQSASTPQNSGDADGTTSDTYMPVEVNEVFPDPASPQLDTSDEFIELYNPYDTPVDLSGYVLKTGSTWSHKFAIEDTIIDSHAYLSLNSSATHLSLSNTGSGVRLYDPNGQVVFEVPSYGKAVTGQSWVRDGSGRWLWTSTPTPGAANVVSSPMTATEAAAKKPAKQAAPKTTKSAKPKSTAAKKSTTNSKAKNSPLKSAASITPGEGSSAQANTTGYVVLAAAACLAVLYAVYEYRRDLAGLIRGSWSKILRR